MTFFWFLVWLLSDTPSFEFTFNSPSPWFIGLIVCVAIDLMGSRAL